MAFSAAMQRRVTPDLRYSQDVFEDVLGARARGVSRWLDVGCGHQILSAWREPAEQAIVASCGMVVGVDYDLPSLRRHRSIRLVSRADATRLPFPDETFDLVTANMVVEHLDDPPAQFREIARVLRPGGVFLFHTPNDRSYIVRMARLFPDGLKRRFAKLLEGRDEEDVFPTHYRANRPSHIAAAAERAGLEVDEVQLIRTSPAFSMVPPLLLPELLWIRALGSPALASHRTNIICALRKPDPARRTPGAASARAHASVPVG